MSTENHRETIISALKHYSAWMDAMVRTSRVNEHTQECAVEKYKADQALQEMENSQ